MLLITCIENILLFCLLFIAVLDIKLQIKLRLFRRKMVSVDEIIFRKNEFLENIFRRLVRTKTLQKTKMRL
jgi:hypothetical protein